MKKTSHHLRQELHFFDTLAAMLAALVIIPAMATTGATLDQGGPGLLFIYLPNLISSMPGSTIIAIIFFVAVLFAGMTSLINLYEAPIATVQEKATFIPRTCMRCHCSNRNHRFTSDSRHRLHMDGYSFYIHLSTGRGTRRNHVLLGM